MISYLVNAFGRSCVNSVPCVVIDPFCGTGVAAVAARANDCHYFVNDKDPYVKAVLDAYLESSKDKW